MRLVAPRKLSQEEVFEVYYYTREAPVSERKHNRELGRQFHVNQTTISRAYTKISDEFGTNPQLYDEYLKWKLTKQEAPYLFNIKKNPDGSYTFESPYPWIVDYMKRRFSRAKNKQKVIESMKQHLWNAEAIWKKLGKKNPANWKENDLYTILAQTSEGSKYSAAIDMRMVSPALKSIDDLTTGLKSEPRTLGIMLLPNFPDLFRQIVETCKQIAKTERERDEINLILTVKSQTGMRTGKRRFEQALWGTKIAEGRSSLEVVGDDFAWQVYEKKEEIWNISWKTRKLTETVVDFVRKYQLKKGDWLVSMHEDRANDILHEACDQLNVSRLNLHDCRKIYVSFLVRSGIPLEKAIRLNVGWKDIGTANKHYLVFEALWSGLEEQKQKFERMF